MKTWDEQGGMAFPKPGDDWNKDSMGMSLRDYFAAKAMQGIIPENMSFESIAQSAYSMADAMLLERSK